MPTRTNDHLRTGSLPRRAVLHAGLAAGLAGAAALTLTGCAGDQDSAGRSRDAKLRRRAARDTARLVAAYEATAAAHPQLAGELRPLRAELVRHLAAFGGDGGRPTPSGSASAPLPAVPEDAKAAKHALARAEQRTADARTDDLVHASPELARLLASTAASNAGHALLLRS